MSSGKWLTFSSDLCVKRCRITDVIFQCLTIALFVTCYSGNDHLNSCLFSKGLAQQVWIKHVDDIHISMPLYATTDPARPDAGTLQWRHKGREGVSNYQPHDCLLICLFSRISKKTSKLRVTGLCKGNRWPVNSPHKGPVHGKCFHLMTSSWTSVIPGGFWYIAACLWKWPNISFGIWCAT